MATNKPRFTITMEDDLYRQVEDYRFDHRYETKSDAVMALIKIGLQVLKEEAEEEKK